MWKTYLSKNALVDYLPRHFVYSDNKRNKKINWSRIFESIFIKLSWKILEFQGSILTYILVKFLWGFKTFLLFDSSIFEETFCAMNRTKIQMFVEGWDCPKFFKTKKIYNNAISFLRRSLWKLWNRHSIESSLQVLETSFFAQSRPSDSHNIRKIANVGHKTTYIL